MSAWEGISVTVAKTDINSLALGGILAALAWLLFLLAKYSPLSDTAVQILIGGIVAFYYLLYGLKRGMLLAAAVAFLTSLHPGFPLNSALILYFMPWPLVKGFIEERIYRSCARETRKASDPREAGDMRRTARAVRMKLTGERSDILCIGLKIFAATILFAPGYVLLRSVFPAPANALNAKFGDTLIPYLGSLAELSSVLILYPAFLAFTFLYERILLFIARTMLRFFA